MTNPGFLSSCSADYLEIDFIIWLFKLTIQSTPFQLTWKLQSLASIFSEMNWEVGLLNNPMGSFVFEEVLCCH